MARYPGKGAAVTDDFSNAPESLAEHRADKAGRADLWAPRDAIISVLREIDAGQTDPVCAIVVWIERSPDGGQRTRYAVSSPNAYAAVGMLGRAASIVNDRANGKEA